MKYASMSSSRRRNHALGKVWSFAKNKAQAGAPRTILGLFPKTNLNHRGKQNGKGSNRP